MHLPFLEKPPSTSEDDGVSSLLQNVHAISLPKTELRRRFGSLGNKAKAEGAMENDIPLEVEKMDEMSQEMPKADLAKSTFEIEPGAGAHLRASCNGVFIQCDIKIRIVPA